MEKYSRDLVEQGKELYIIAGPEGRQKALADGKVVVPQFTWKVVVVLDRPGAPVTPNTRVIAVQMPNIDALANTDWQDYRVSVDAIEAATGYDFLTEVSPDIQAQIESRIDNQ